MKVIVKDAGFYSGTWYDAGAKHQEMPDKVARQFLPPRGHQLALPPARREPERPNPKTPAAKAE